MVEAVSANALPLSPARERAPSDSKGPGMGTAPPQGAGPRPPDQRTGEAGSFDEQTLDKIAARLVTLDSRLAISQDDFIRRFIYKFVDTGNGDVIRQYPHEKVVESLHAMEEARERFVDKQA